MSYVNKRQRVFSEGSGTVLVPTRSEARMKRYPSSTDLRAWCDIVEERRQHILEYAAKNKQGICLEKLIPMDVLVNTMVYNKNVELLELERQVQYLEDSLALFKKINLTAKQKVQLDTLLKENNLETNEPADDDNGSNCTI
ncbi:unnamed protein product [Acanthoscelides obtectus]|uniref:Uncharacterized protein n=1 Tax=Acanthoscelides obtectus TaxID=200917 RepID=A0A9P0KFV3_ACAOB|nr:unnamed protein product [Acanthoscelides obtectus]CAK1644633.1 hypothetical protein AOBTE_LOCUS13903 [Acanthoscelides obtectus]